MCVSGVCVCVCVCVWLLLSVLLCQNVNTSLGNPGGFSAALLRRGAVFLECNGCLKRLPFSSEAATNNRPEAYLFVLRM